MQQETVFVSGSDYRVLLKNGEKSLVNGQEFNRMSKVAEFAPDPELGFAYRTSNPEIIKTLKDAIARGCNDFKLLSDTKSVAPAEPVKPAPEAQESPVASGKPQSVCPVCNKTFNAKVVPFMHVRTHPMKREA